MIVSRKLGLSKKVVVLREVIPVAGGSECVYSGCGAAAAAAAAGPCLPDQQPL